MCRKEREMLRDLLALLSLHSSTLFPTSHIQAPYPDCLPRLAKDASGRITLAYRRKYFCSPWTANLERDVCKSDQITCSQHSHVTALAN